MKDYVLKFPSREIAFSLAKTAGLTLKNQDSKDVLTEFTPEYGIFVQGVITQTAPLGPDLKPIAPPVVLNGWWVRVRLLASDGRPEPDLPAAFRPYVTEERPDGLWGIA